MAGLVNNVRLRARLEDVAALSRTARSTCSAVLANRSDCYASEATRKRIIAAAKQLGYRPNRFASSLRGKRTRQVGMILPKIFSANQVNEEKFTPIEDQAHQSGYRVLFASHMYCQVRELEYIRSLLADRVDGLLLYANSDANADIVQAMLEDRLPLVTIESPFAFPTPNVRVRRELGAYRQVMHLWKDAGRRKLAFLVGATIGVEGQAKIAGYRRALTELGSSLEEHVFIDSTNGENTSRSKIQNGQSMTRQALADPKDFDGMVLSSDAFALSAFSVLQEAGVRVPDDVAVIGFDDQDFVSVLPVPLSTIRQPREVGQLAFDLLMRMIDNGMPEHAGDYEQIQLEPKLIVRESTLPSAG